MIPVCRWRNWQLEVKYLVRDGASIWTQAENSGAHGFHWPLHRVSLLFSVGSTGTIPCICVCLTHVNYFAFTPFCKEMNPQVGFRWSACQFSRPVVFILSRCNYRSPSFVLLVFHRVGGWWNKERVERRITVRLQSNLDRRMSIMILTFILKAFCCWLPKTHLNEYFQFFVILCFLTSVENSDLQSLLFYF